ncbi:COMM domain-containing protein [Entamoeba marina]
MNQHHKEIQTTSSNGVNKRYVVRLLKTDDFNVEDKPIFIDLSWRLDIIMSHRHLYNTIQPSFIIKFDIADVTLAKKDQNKIIEGDGVVKVSLNSLRKSMYFEMSPTVLNTVINQLENGFNELRSVNTKQILRKALNQ